MPGRRAGSPIAVYVHVQCQEPKTGQQNSIVKTNNIVNLGINYLCLAVSDSDPHALLKKPNMFAKFLIHPWPNLYNNTFVHNFLVACESLLQTS